MARAIEERRERAAVLDKNRNENELSKLPKESLSAKEQLNTRKKELMSLECILETKHAIKRYSPEGLGLGNTCGGQAAMKLRYEVIDKMAKLGSGLTPAQKNEWAWFREAWGTRMREEHNTDWGGTFSQWMQHILDDITGGAFNAFSTFMHEGTIRIFSKTAMLVMPSMLPDKGSGNSSDGEY